MSVFFLFVQRDNGGETWKNKLKSGEDFFALKLNGFLNFNDNSLKRDIVPRQRPLFA